MARWREIGWLALTLATLSVGACADDGSGRGDSQGGDAASAAGAADAVSGKGANGDASNAGNPSGGNDSGGNPNGGNPNGGKANGGSAQVAGASGNLSDAGEASSGGFGGSVPDDDASAGAGGATLTEAAIGFGGEGTTRCLQGETLMGPGFYPVEDDVSDLLLRDVNHDQRDDLLMLVPGGVSVRNGKLGGGFEDAKLLPAGGNPGGFTVADFDDDGVDDLAVADVTSWKVSVLLGKDDGSFEEAVSYEAAQYMQGLTAVDLDGDGFPDLAAVASDSGVVTLFNHGDGSFGAPDLYPGIPSPHGIASLDVNADGAEDIVVAVFGGNEGGDTLRTLLNDGTGALTLAQSSVPGISAAAVLTAQLNADSLTDLVVLDLFDSVASVLLALPGGGFAKPRRYPVGDFPYSITTVDLDSDGFLDLATSSMGGVSMNVSVLRNQGDGRFAAATNYPVGAFPLAIAAGHLNDDGAPDLVVSHSADLHSLSLLLNRGHGTFDAPRRYPSGPDPSDGLAADFNEDGRPDLAVALTAGISVSLNLGNKRFSAPATYATGSTWGLAMADLDNDGHLDLVASGETMHLFRGMGDGTFAAPSTIPQSASTIVVADLDDDGNQDLVFGANGGVDVLYGAGGGVFPSEPLFYSTSVGEGLRAIAVGYYDGDDRLDIATLGEIHERLSVALGQGQRQFSVNAFEPTGAAPFALASADFDDDGDIDFITLDRGLPVVSVYLNDGDANFAARTSFPAGKQPERMVAGDFDHNGTIDLLLSNIGDSTLTLLSNDGHAAFVSQRLYGAGAGSCGVAAADFDGDLRSDLAVVDSFNTFSILFSTCPTP